MVASQWVPESFQEAMQTMSRYGIIINAVLFVLNMLPILPLDGGRFVETFLPAKLSQSFQKIEPYGMWILIGLMYTGLLSKIMAPFLRIVLSLIPV